MTIILPVSLIVGRSLPGMNHSRFPTHPPGRIKEIQCPIGFERPERAAHSFGEWLGNLSLRKENTVYLYNGLPKENQSAQYAVLNIPVGNKDLQQCADAIMRLRAMWLHSESRDAEIHFEDNEGRSYKLPATFTQAGFDRYLENVFAHCGTISLSKQLRPKATENLEPGDVFIRGGSPGHAMIVVDKAMNKEGKVIFMLAQSYMPAQDIHIVKNPLHPEMGPWFYLETGRPLLTPEWVFQYNQLKTW